MGTLHRLPSGSYVLPRKIRAIEARPLRHAFIDRTGRQWPAAVYVETRHQVLRVPCESLEAAYALRDELGELVNAERAPTMPADEFPPLPAATVRRTS